MSIVGKYRPCSFIIFSKDGMKMGSKEEYIENIKANSTPDMLEHSLQEAMMMVNMILDISEDGKIYTYYQLPGNVSKEEIDKAIEAGELQLAPMEGYMCVDKPYDWKEEDGVFKYDTRQYREVLGEQLTSWDDLKFDGKTVTMSSGMSVFEKIEE